MEKFPKNLIFLRHVDNVDSPNLSNNDLPISKKGIEQAKWVSDVLAEQIKNSDIIFTSTSARTIETAEIISKDPVKIKEDRLLEAGWGPGYKGTESDKQAKKRIGDFLDEISEKYNNKNILIVTHGRLLKLAEDYIENKTLPKHNIENGSMVHYSVVDNEFDVQADYLRFKYIVSPFDKEINSKIVKKGVNLFFVRHGESTSNRDGILAGGSDFPLTDNGILQAERTAISLLNSKVKFNKIFSSPLSRSLDTAKIISRELNMPEGEIVKLEELTGCGGGSLEGRPYSDWYSIPPDELVPVYGAESYDAQRRRIGRAILNILKNSRAGDSVLVSSHSSVFQVLRALNEGITDENETFRQDKPSPSNYIRIEI